MEFWAIAEIIGGLFAGLLLGPLIYIVTGFIAYMISEKKIEKKMDDERYQHTQIIEAQKKRYEKANVRYMKSRLKLEKYIGRGYKRKREENPEVQG